MKRREAMLLARSIAGRLILVVMQQGKDRPSYSMTHEQLAQISADALDVCEYLCVPREE